MKKKLLTFGIMLAAGALFGVSTSTSASALTYQESVDVQFTFNPTITISLSSADLVISNLAPGSYADSNIITVIASTNNPTGYTLYATAGDGTTYTNTNLINGTNNFLSVATDASYASMNSADPNKWAFSFSSNSGSTWSNYSGLPYYTNTGKTLVSSNSNTTDTIQFKIGAKASSDQPSGEYRNIVNFIAVTNPEPEPSLCATGQLEMQNVSQWESTVTTGNEVTVCDNRDGKTYTAARLADGNIWMTQNLDFDIVDGGAALNSTNTDVPSNWADAGNLTNTYSTGTTTWTYSKTAPQSYNPGDVCWDGTMNDDWDGTLDNETTACTSSNMHYHIGNYYNWTAAVAMSNSSAYTANNTDADQSICPAGWMLPKSGTTLTGSGSFYYLVNQLGLTAGSAGSAGQDGNIQDSPVYFPYAGDWLGNSNGVGSDSLYWSSVVRSSSTAYALSFYVDGNLYPQLNVANGIGYSVRCVAR